MLSHAVKQLLAATLLLILCTACGTTAVNDRELPSLSYCELRRQEHNYLGELVRVRALWRHKSGDFSYIHSEPQCYGRSGVGFYKVADPCPQMASLPVDLKGDFEAQIVVVGALSTHASMGSAKGDGTVFAALCVEAAKERSK